MPAGTLVPAHGSPPRTVSLPNSGTANLQSLAGLEKLTMVGTGAANMGLVDTADSAPSSPSRARGGAASSSNSPAAKRRRK